MKVTHLIHYPSLFVFFAFLLFASPVAAVLPDGDEPPANSVEAARQAFLNAQTAYLTAKSDSIEKALDYSNAKVDSVPKATAYFSAQTDSTNKRKAYTDAKADSIPKATAYFSAQTDSTNKYKAYTDVKNDSTNKYNAYIKVQDDSTSKYKAYIKAQGDSLSKATAYNTVYTAYTKAKNDSTTKANAYTRAKADSISLRQRIAQHHAEIYAAATQALSRLPKLDVPLHTFTPGQAATAALFGYPAVSVNTAITTLNAAAAIIDSIYSGTFIPKGEYYRAKRDAYALAPGFSGTNTCVTAVYKAVVEVYKLATSILSVTADSIKSKGILIAADSAVILPLRVLGYIPGHSTEYTLPETSEASLIAASTAQSKAVTAYANYVAARDLFPPTAYRYGFLSAQAVADTATTIFNTAATAVSGGGDPIVNLTLNHATSLSLAILGGTDVSVDLSLNSAKLALSGTPQILAKIPTLLEAGVAPTSAIAYKNTAEAYKKAADTLSAVAALETNKTSDKYKAATTAGLAYSATYHTAMAAYLAAFVADRDTAYLKALDAIRKAVDYAHQTAQAAGSTAANNLYTTFEAFFNVATVAYTSAQATRAAQVAVAAFQPVPDSLATYRTFAQAAVDSLTAYRTFAQAAVDSMAAYHTARQAAVDSLTAYHTARQAAITTLTAYRTAITTLATAATDTVASFTAYRTATTAYRAALATLTAATEAYATARATAQQTYTAYKTAEAAYKNFLSTEQVFSTDFLPAEIYTLTGVYIGSSTEGLPAGIYLIKRGDTVTKVFLKK
ncbi:MAG: hypothetical protein LBT73_00940 [Tannerellaceae bacterium]|jgi:hypothetical protein|nr:hypothetical protein [Tannerellaceae bacterium]